MRVPDARAETLRRRLALYRDCLKHGALSELACHYLREIVAAERELERIGDDRQRPGSS